MPPRYAPLTDTENQRTRLTHWLLGLALIILAGWAMRAMATVAVPLVFSIFLALIVHPLDARIARAMPQRLAWLGRAAVMAVLLSVLALFIAGMGFAAQQFAQSLPAMSDRIGQWLSVAQTSGGGSQLVTALRDSIGSLGSWAVDQASAVAETLIGATGGLLAALIVVFFLVLLGLGEASTWSSKVHAISGGDSRTDWIEISRVTAARLRRFLLVRTGVGVLTAAVYSAWLAVFGLDLLAVWAILAFLLTFIPNFGSIISGTLPTLYAFVMLDPATAFLLGAGIFVIEQVIGNVIDPRLQGRETVLSPFVILSALLFWGWLWGVAGALLATPITIVMVAVCNEVPGLRPIALLLSNQPAPERLDKALDQ